LKSAHQNDPKHIKKLISNKKKLNFLETVPIINIPIHQTKQHSLTSIDKANNKNDKTKAF
jgi:hypothetical protein